jgi:predicted DsbA family dithiol-disulfide isomerase/uncharacterized membrane protein
VGVSFPRLFVLRACALLVVALSSALFVHYIDPVGSAFCGGASGCEAVRRSDYAYFGVAYLNLPLLGVVAYSVLLLIGWRGRAGELAALRVLAVLGAAVALLLLLLQTWVVGEYCWLCVIVDGLAVVAGFCALGLDTSERPLLRPWAWPVLALVALLAAPCFNLVKPLTPVPPLVEQLYQPGKINVVEFADFECPFCVRLHPVLKELNARYEGRVHFQRLHAPLPLHPHALPAARAQICASQQGRGEAMADQLFELELDDRTGIELAKALGLDMPAFDRCLVAPSTGQRLAADWSRFEATEFRSLPTTFVGPYRFVGIAEQASLLRAYQSVAAGESAGGVPAWLYFPGVLLLCGAILWVGRSRSGR